MQDNGIQRAMTMQQAQDFLDESRALNALLASLPDAAFAQATLFKGWSIDAILRHLHVWNIAAGLSLSEPQAFAAFTQQMASGIRGGRLPDFEAEYLNGLSGQKLASAWIERAEAAADAFAIADPKARLPWVGPEMSAISSITARLMETWAHGQAIYDLLGAERIDEDRIGNIVRLGVNTYGWTFKNRREEVLGPMPHLRLIAPSGAIWEYGEAPERVGDSGSITGSATEFCQVVTQCRNIADTSLEITGDVATRWMSIAQCFAGPPNDPPPPGMRRRQ